MDDSLVATRKRRANAGLRLKHLIELEEQASQGIQAIAQALTEDDENVNLLFEEDENDDEFVDFDVDNANLDGIDQEDEEEDEEDRDQDDDDRASGEISASDTDSPHSLRKRSQDDANLDDVFSDSEISASDDDESEGERELARNETAGKKKRQKRSALVPAIKKTFTLQPDELAKKPKNHLVSSTTLLMADRRSSSRSAAVESKQALVQRLKESEQRRASFVPVIREVHVELTQEEKLAEAIETERLNVLSLNLFREQEFVKKEHHRVALMSKRKKLVNVIRLNSQEAYVSPTEEVAHARRAHQLQGKAKKRPGRRRKFQPEPLPQARLVGEVDTELPIVKEEMERLRFEQEQEEKEREKEIEKEEEKEKERKGEEEINLEKKERSQELDQEKEPDHEQGRPRGTSLQAGNDHGDDATMIHEKELSTANPEDIAMTDEQGLESANEGDPTMAGGKDSPAPAKEGQATAADVPNPVVDGVVATPIAVEDEASVLNLKDRADIGGNDSDESLPGIAVKTETIKMPDLLSQTPTVESSESSQAVHQVIRSDDSLQERPDLEKRLIQEMPILGNVPLTVESPAELIPNKNHSKLAGATTGVQESIIHGDDDANEESLTGTSQRNAANQETGNFSNDSEPLESGDKKAGSPAELLESGDKDAGNSSKPLESNDEKSFCKLENTHPSITTDPGINQISAMDQDQGEVQNTSNGLGIDGNKLVEPVLTDTVSDTATHEDHSRLVVSDTRESDAFDENSIKKEEDGSETKTDHQAHNADEPLSTEAVEIGCEIFEGPAQKIARNMIYFIDFDDSDRNMRLNVANNLKSILFGPQSLLPALRRFKDLKTIARIGGPHSPYETDQGNDDLFEPVSAVSPDDAVFEGLRKLPRLGVAQDFVEEVHQDIKDDSVPLTIEHEAPTGLYLPNGNKKPCSITGTEVKYFDPANGIPYSSVETYRFLKQIEQGLVPWYSISPDQDDAGLVELYLGSRDGSVRHAKGVPGGFDG